MKQQHDLDRLKKVNKVDAPPFLLTRIQAKIDARQMGQAPVPVQWKWASALALAIMLLLNVMAVKNSHQTTGAPDAIETLADGMLMNASNQLYHE